ncbi:MAG: serine/threonine kinase [Ignavibacteria bacterium]|nr:serine/threonine kinase [Ignavibacteria bacterium]
MSYKLWIIPSRQEFLLTLWKSYFFFLLCFLILSCSSEPATIDNSRPSIESFVPENTFIGDTVTFYGAGFGLPCDSCYISFRDSLTIKSKNCIKWNNIIIKFEVPDYAVSSTFSVHSNGKASYPVYLKIDRLPPFEVVSVPSGSFSMGSNYGYANERPVHTVILTNPFNISKYEISNRLWYSVLGIKMPDSLRGELPIKNIDWQQAINFCNTLSQIQGYSKCYIITGGSVIWDTTANGWRLPNEAEWEYACRAGSTSDFSGSSNLDALGWYDSNSGMTLHPGGAKQANAFGIYDMHGNVWEWCWDAYSDSYLSGNIKTNPLGRDSIRTLFSNKHVLRGGSAVSGTAYCRSSNRTYPENNYLFCGLRIVRFK